MARLAVGTPEVEGLRILAALRGWRLPGRVVFEHFEVDERRQATGPSKR